TAAPVANEWNATGGGSWGNANNWTFDTIPPANEVAIFSVSINATSSITLDGNQQAAGIQFSNAQYSYSIDQGSGSGSLTLSNGGSPAEVDDLAGSHSITAPVIITPGGLALNATAGSGNALTISGNISESGGSSGVTSIGTGNLTLSGLNSFTGPMTIDAGTTTVTDLDIGGNASSIGASSNAASNLVVNGGTLRYIGATASTDRLFTINATADIAASGTGPLTFSNTGSVAFVNPGSGSPSTLRLSGNNSGANTFAPLISDNGPEATTLVKGGSGRWVLTNQNTYSGGTFVTSGTLAIGTTNALPTAGTLTVNGTGTFDLAGNGQTIGSLSDGGVTTGTVTSSSGTPSLTVGGGSYAGNISGSLALALEPSATLTLGGNNTYTGQTALTDGDVLTTTSNGALGNATAATGGLVFNSTATAATVNFTSANPAISSINDTASAVANNIVLGNTTSGTATTLTIGGGDVPSVFSGNISDGIGTNSTAIGSINVTGTSTLLLSGNNTYTGGTHILGGTLQVTSAASLGLASGNLGIGNGTLEAVDGFSTGRNYNLTNANSTILVDAGQALTVTGNVTGTGTLNYDGGVGSNLTFSGTNTYTGGSIVNGAMSIGSTTGLGTGNVTLLNGSSLTVTNAAQSFANNITIPSGATDSLTFSSTGSTSFSGIVTGASSSVLNFSTNSGPMTLNGAAGQFANFNGTINVLNIGGAGLRLFGPTSFANATLNFENTNGADFFVRGSTTVTIGALSGVAGTGLTSASNDTGDTIWQIGGLNTSTAYAGNITQNFGEGSSNSITKVGTGSLTLSGTENYTGATLVSAGNLVVDGSMSNTTVTVSSGAVLGGNGTISSSVSLAASSKIYLGPGINELTVGNLTWNTDGATAGMLFVLGSSGVSDLLNITGNLTKGTNPGGVGQFIFDFQDTGMYGGVYTLFDFPTGQGGAFATSDFTAENLPAGMTGAFTFNPTGVTDGSLTFAINAIPEPATWTLLLGSGTLLYALRRKRKQQAR
ncbi:MAG: autotransporter-associated beta strand repeat-containing protein, partial [Opitutales bacterium]